MFGLECDLPHYYAQGEGSLRTITEYRRLASASNGQSLADDERGYKRDYSPLRKDVECGVFRIHPQATKMPS
jgi:hypothetical protein